MALVFSDMDGTFLADDKSIPPRNLEALEYLHDIGVGFVPCTGRIGRDVDARVAGHPATTHIVASNGARIWQKDHQSWVSVWSKSLSIEQVMWMLDVLSSYDLMFEVFSDTKIFVETAKLDCIEEFFPNQGMWGYVRSTRTGVDDVRRAVELTEEIDRINIRTHQVDYEAVGAALSENNSITVAMANTNGIDVTSAGVDKGVALRALAELNGCGVEKCMAFGDGGNDMDMLVVAGVGVAMENAFARVKAVADDCALSCNEAGVAEYIFSHKDFFDQD